MGVTGVESVLLLDFPGGYGFKDLKLKSRVCAQAKTETENWCGVLQEVALPGTGGDPEAFLGAAVRFANERCWGTLSCCLMVGAPPAPLRALDVSFFSGAALASLCCSGSFLGGPAKPASRTAGTAVMLWQVLRVPEMLAMACCGWSVLWLSG